MFCLGFLSNDVYDLIENGWELDIIIEKTNKDLSEEHKCKECAKHTIEQLWNMGTNYDTSSVTVDDIGNISYSYIFHIFSPFQLNFRL